MAESMKTRAADASAHHDPVAQMWAFESESRSLEGGEGVREHLMSSHQKCSGAGFQRQPSGRGAPQTGPLSEVAGTCGRHTCGGCAPQGRAVSPCRDLAARSWEFPS